MLYEKFVIRNFKGIREATIAIDPFGRARVYSLVGLNESGKTTLLEAIHGFSPDADTQIVVGSASSIDDQRRQRVPKDKVADFTGDVEVTAHIRLDANELVRIDQFCRSRGFRVDLTSKPDKFTYTRIQRYKNGEFVGAFRTSNFPCMVKSGRQKKFRAPRWEDEQSVLWDYLETQFPLIAYFPTFIFDFPSRIYLSNRNITKVNAFYRRLFQDILDYDGRNHNIKTHILERIGKEEYRIEFVNFFPVYRKSNDKDKIQQVIDRAARVVTNVVFEKWNEIFDEDTAGKEIIIDFDVSEAPDIVMEDGTKEKNVEHDVFIEFYVKDGINRFPIKDRSLGFRWFFSFLMFTQFRAARSDGRPILFLLDEPASNLHAAAQQKLIESFPDVAKNPHNLIYSTHSHYMIEPNWLEQCYIVKNETDPDQSVSLAEATKDDDSYDIQAIKYGEFVNSNPGKVSYFQPIIDRLNVVPSRFDIDVAGIILEGKSDYYILSYFASVHWKRKLSLFPGLGAGTLDALVAIHKGWGLPVKMMLDSDTAGEKERDRYKDVFLLTDDNVRLLDDFVPSLKDIESLLEADDRNMVLSKLPGREKVNKKDILRFFQQHLASKKRFKVSAGCAKKAKRLLDELEKFQSS